MPLLTAIAASVPSRLATFAASATWLGVSAQAMRRRLCEVIVQHAEVVFTFHTQQRSEC